MSSLHAFLAELPCKGSLAWTLKEASIEVSGYSSHCTSFLPALTRVMYAHTRASSHTTPHCCWKTHSSLLECTAHPRCFVLPFQQCPPKASVNLIQVAENYNLPPKEYTWHPSPFSAIRCHSTGQHGPLENAPLHTACIQNQHSANTLENTHTTGSEKRRQQSKALTFCQGSGRWFPKDLCNAAIFLINYSSGPRPLMF